MDRFDAMTAFVAVAELESFAAGARQLGRSASAVTRLVAALEKQVGARLLQRTTRSVTLTDSGSRYLQRARRIVAEVAEAEALAHADRTTPMGRLVVAAPNVFGRLHVTPVFSRYLERYPAVTGELTLADRTVNLVEDGVDLAVRIGALSDSSVIAKAVGTTRRVLVASKKYLDHHQPIRTLEALQQHRLVHFTGLGSTAEWRFRDQSVRFTPAFITNSIDAAIGFAERGGGLAQVMGYQVAEAVRAKRLRVVLERFEPKPSPIQLLYPSNRLLSAKVRALIDLITSSCDWRFVEIG